jgi:hypothetical protein
LLNTNIAGSAAPDSTYVERYGGAVIGCCGAPFTISVTVNGFTYTRSNVNPFINRSYLIDGLSTGLGGQDQVYQEIGSTGCSTGIGGCTSSYILATSTQFPFVPSLDFSQSLSVNGNQVDGQTYFLFTEGLPVQSSGFYGSIDSLSVNPVPAPALGTGLPGLIAACGGLFAWWRRRRKRV